LESANIFVHCLYFRN